MKVSNRSHLYIDKLNKKSLDKILIYENENDKIDYFKNIHNIWKLNNLDFKKDINIVSDLYFNTFQEKGHDKLFDITKNLLFSKNEDLLCSGTYITKELSFSISFNSFDNCCFFLFTNNEPASILAHAVFNFNKNIENTIYVHNDIKKQYDKTFINDLDYCSNSLMFWLSFILFKKYADVETVYLESNSRKKNNKCKYINETNENITFLDSTWFTNLIKSDAFKVSGHFRLQPYKDGSKKIIWISEFEKTGYNRKAGLNLTN